MEVNTKTNSKATQDALFQDNTQMGKSLRKLSTRLQIKFAEDMARKEKSEFAGI
ncbi:MAG: hypothetical protein LBB36_00730 [Fibromonadaceae bacterium]|jgi:flagellin-like hook-associated protein FlgL|nr:hypothetical protein [Fibromonadaceae bacterium]